MTTQVLLGVDIGTYSSKGVLVTETGEVLAAAAAEHTLSLPRPGWAEHDPEGVWWRDFVSICRELLAKSGIEPQRIAAVGISTISPAVVAIDRRGAPLRPAILYGIDTRATDEIEMLTRLTGASLTSQSAAPKIMWIRRHEPEVWARTDRIVNGSGYLLLKLTGEATLDVYDATVFAPFFDPHRLDWDPALADVVAPVDMMPRVTWTCDVAGRVTPEAARLTGLAAGTPVITGTADAAAEAVSAGLSRVGEMMMMYGSSTFYILRSPRLLDTRTFWNSHFLEPDTYVLAGGTATAGSLTRWFRDQFGPLELADERAGGGNAYTALARLAAESPPGARGLVMLPYFAGERMPVQDPQARGAILGLTLSHTRADCYRALLESVGYAIRHNLDAMRAEGIAAERILAVGGGTHNRLWMQIISDIAGIEQHIPEQQIGASYGDAFLAGVGAGLFRSTAQAAGWVRMRETVRPHPDAQAQYERTYSIYRELYTHTAALMHRLGALDHGN
ncbi:MAG: FGGY-family carbohydrate kinase [Anaerolineales bacterium]|nr:FGGY-family carbohydrate kinase [Anaerolineales bacterium]